MEEYTQHVDKLRNILICNQGVLVRKDTLSNLRGKYRTNDIKSFLPKQLGGTAEQDPCDANINENRLTMDESKFNSRLLLVSTGRGQLKSRMKTRNAFTQNMPSYTQAMTLVTTDEDQDFVTQKNNELTEGLYARKLGQNTYSNVDSCGGVASLPDVETCHNRKNLSRK